MIFVPEVRNRGVEAHASAPRAFQISWVKAGQCGLSQVNTISAGRYS